jgi:hypothetical protein
MCHYERFRHHGHGSSQHFLQRVGGETAIKFAYVLIFNQDKIMVIFKYL